MILLELNCKRTTHGVHHSLLDWVKFWVLGTHSSFKSSFCLPLLAMCLGLPGWLVSLLKGTMANLPFFWELSWTWFSLPVAFACLLMPKTLHGDHLILVGPSPSVVKGASWFSISFLLHTFWRCPVLCSLWGSLLRSRFLHSLITFHHSFYPRLSTSSPFMCWLCAICGGSCGFSLLVMVCFHPRFSFCAHVFD